MDALFHAFCRVFFWFDNWDFEEMQFHLWSRPPQREMWLYLCLKPMKRSQSQCDYKQSEEVTVGLHVFSVSWSDHNCSVILSNLKRLQYNCICVWSTWRYHNCSVISVKPVWGLRLRCNGVFCLLYFVHCTLPSAETQTSIAVEVITVGKCPVLSIFSKNLWRDFKTPYSIY